MTEENENQTATEATEKPLFTDEELYNIRSIKLNNGETMLACILCTDAEHMIVKRPCQVQKINGDDGSVAMVLTKWQPFSVDPNHVIFKQSLVSYCKINQAMIDFYILAVQNQINEENSSKEPIVGKEWPEWMDSPLSKTQLN